MKLSRLEIYGFKSFAKKLDLKLTGGMTAIVGPNGCGKTNVVDAIRWVLGEQRPSQIRLERMEDVLFKGSNTRRQLGMSEVSLTIDNESGILPLEMPEVTITRRLFRSGESDYMINRKPCRLADIGDLLMDTGMGTDSYSLFEVAMINAILSDKTDDRRHIFEEAAGVTKYKARRKSALNKLAGIEGDLERVGDIISELQRRVDSLKRQASRARRYRDLKSELKNRTIAVAAFEIKSRRKELDAAARELAGLETAIEALRVGMSRATAEAENTSAGIVTVEKELEAAGREYADSMALINEKEKEQARLDSRIESLGEMASRAREDSRRNAAALDKLAVAHGECAGNLADVTGRLQEVERDFGGARTAYDSLHVQVDEASRRHTILSREIREQSQKTAAQKAELANVAARRESGEQRLGEIERRIGELTENMHGLEGELKLHADKALSKAAEESGITGRVADMKRSLDDALEELAVLDSRFREAVEKQAALRAERDFLAEVIRSFEGYSEGVRNASNAECLKGRTFGVLADIITTDEAYVAAVDAAIRERLQAVLVASPEDAASGARYLARERNGRAVFIPVDGVASHQPAFDAPDAPGVIGPAWRFVSVEDRFEPVVTRLLENVVFVDTLETALRLHESDGGRFVYVTLDGEKVGSLGDIYGGKIRDESSATIGRAEKLKAMTAELKRLDADVGDLKEHRAELSEKTSVYRGLIVELEKTLDDIRKVRSATVSSEATLKARLESIEENIAGLRKEADAVKASFVILEENRRRLSESLDLGEAPDSREKELVDLTETLAGLRTGLEKRRSALSSLEIERAGLKEKKNALERELDTIGERRETLAQSSGRTRQEIDAAERETLEIGKRKQTVLKELEKLEERHESLKHTRDICEHRYGELRAERSAKEKELQELRRRLDEHTRRESSLTLKRDETAMVMKNIRERLVDEYYIGPDDIERVELSDDFDSGTEKRLIEDLRRKIHLLGDVNLAAERDYEEERKRFDFLVGERDDLVEASNTLKDTILKINAIARARFTETFELIRRNFQQMFNEFFDGGVCDLDLEENIDPLEANIRITARPPGKNVRSINLLSSGERALTAISLLFAIYLVKPSPFCILDEVDAPLDDANIDRFHTVIRRFSERTQFIMVTHNKKTMAAADNLYGITMAEPGLSTLVSVRLADTEPEEGERDVESAAVDG